MSRETKGEAQPAQAGPAIASTRRQGWGICIFLVLLTFLVFGQTLRHAFVNYDDPLYVTANPLVKNGLTLEGIARVFTHFEVRFYTPLTLISHMACWQVFGQWAGGHHLVNVLLHAATAIMLFLVLRRMTGASWRSAFVAALFAIHPLHVESVAWVAERNDLLAGFFFVLTLWAYVRHAQGSWAWGSYLPVVFVYLLGLLSKPTLVTVPFVLLLLDYWPLKRSMGFSRLVIEKLPLFALSIAASVIAVIAEGKSVAPAEMYPPADRIGNALVSYVIYIGQTFYPSELSAFYPRPGIQSAITVIFAAVLLLVICAAVFQLRKKGPYLVTGWLWFLGMLVPMIGIVQVGEFAHADRYTYLSQIGLYFIVVWGFCDLCHSARLQSIAATATIAALVPFACLQTSHWRDSESLFTHALAIDPDNYVACNNLGLALSEKGRTGEAVALYEQALRIQPYSVPAHNNIGAALLQQGAIEEAIRHFKKALETRPDSVIALYSLGNIYLQLGEPVQAVGYWRQVVENQPNHVEAKTKIAWVLAACSDASLRNGTKAVELAQQANHTSGGKNPMVLCTLAAAYAEAGKFDDALKIAQQGARLAAASGDPQLIAVLDHEVELFRQKSPLRISMSREEPPANH